jgi:hypothetical protein
MDFELEIKDEFSKLMKAGKVQVFKLMDEVDGYIDETTTLTMLERRMDAIVKQVRAEKKFYFNQFKEVWPFVLSERKLKEALLEKDEYIILE